MKFTLRDRSSANIIPTEKIYNVLVTNILCNLRICCQTYEHPFAFGMYTIKTKASFNYDSALKNKPKTNFMNAVINFISD